MRTGHAIHSTAGKNSTSSCARYPPAVMPEDDEERGDGEQGGAGATWESFGQGGQDPQAHPALGQAGWAAAQSISPANSLQCPCLFSGFAPVALAGASALQRGHRDGGRGRRGQLRVVAAVVQATAFAGASVRSCTIRSATCTRLRSSSRSRVTWKCGVELLNLVLQQLRCGARRAPGACWCARCPRSPT